MGTVFLLAALLAVFLIGEEFMPKAAGSFSYLDLVSLAQSAGFAGADAYIAAAIALAESSGDPNAVGDLELTPGGSIGLWQINLKAHPEYNAQELTNPQTNAAAAFAIYQQRGNSFLPWSTFKSGAYSKYLDTSTADDSTSADNFTDDGGFNG